MKRLCYRVALAICFLWITITPALAAAYLIPGGQVVGLQLQNGSVTVAAFDDVLGAGAREAGLKIGDQICQIDGIPLPAPRMCAGHWPGRPGKFPFAFAEMERNVPSGWFPSPPPTAPGWGSI